MKKWFLIELLSIAFLFSCTHKTGINYRDYNLSGDTVTILKIDMSAKQGSETILIEGNSLTYFKKIGAMDSLSKNGKVIGKIKLREYDNYKYLIDALNVIRNEKSLACADPSESTLVRVFYNGKRYENCGSTILNKQFDFKNAIQILENSVSDIPNRIIR